MIAGQLRGVCEPLVDQDNAMQSFPRTWETGAPSCNRSDQRPQGQADGVVPRPNDERDTFWRLVDGRLCDAPLDARLGPLWLSAQASEY